MATEHLFRGIDMFTILHHNGGVDLQFQEGTFLWQYFTHSHLSPAGRHLRRLFYALRSACYSWTARRRLREALLLPSLRTHEMISTDSTQFRAANDNAVQPILIVNSLYGNANCGLLVYLDILHSTHYTRVCVCEVMCVLCTCRAYHQHPHTGLYIIYITGPPILSEQSTHILFYKWALCIAG